MKKIPRHPTDTGGIFNISTVYEVFAYLVDVARADGQDNVAGARGLSQGLLYLPEIREEAAAGDVLREVGRRDAEGVVLARGVDLREEGDVRAAELLYEVVKERSGARVGVRLEDEYRALVAAAAPRRRAGP